MKKITVLFIFSFFTSLSIFASEGKLITDSLVQNLDCSKLSRDDVFSKIGKGAFSKDSHLSARNFKSGYLGVCWSLARAQRLVFFFAKNDSNDILANSNKYDVMNMFRGSEPMTTDTKSFNSDSNQAKENFNIKYTNMTYSMLNNLYKNNETGRNFNDDISTYQSFRFHKISNLYMSLGAGARTKEENIVTVNQLIKNLDQNRLVLLNLRADQFRQHIVLAKDYRKQKNGDILFLTYDSNYPREDKDLIFEKETGQFISRSSMGPFWNEIGLSAYNHLGVFIVDEDEMDKIETEVINYYKKVCEK